MLTSLSKIENPVARSLTAAATAFSIATVVSGLTIAAIAPKNKSAYQTGIYTALIALVSGGALGLVTKGKARQDDASSPIDSTLDDLQTWKDWRNFIVDRKVEESEEITSFYLKPADGGEIPNFQPGQFLTIKLDIPGQPRPVIRTYSLSDYPEPCNYYRLSIKREPAPKGQDVPPGLSSNFMHDFIHEGSVIPAKPPSGKFYLDVRQSRPVVLISNGVGITPMISMAKACSRINPIRSIWFVHGARDGRYHAFRDEVRAIAAQNPNLNIHYAYSRPQAKDEGHFHSTGYADIDLIRSLVSQEAEFFLCGSLPFLQSLRDGLKAWGVPDDRVFFELFMKARTATSESISPVVEVNEGTEIVFTNSRKTVAWDSSQESLLEFAEANDLNPDYSCRQGICGTCACKIREGEVEYQTEPSTEIAPGEVLICIAKPKTARVVLEL